jgi:hypothetical protein
MLIPVLLARSGVQFEPKELPKESPVVEFGKAPASNWPDWEANIGFKFTSDLLMERIAKLQSKQDGAPQKK